MTDQEPCLVCAGVEPAVADCVDCMGTGWALTDEEWKVLHDEFVARLDVGVDRG